MLRRAVGTGILRRAKSRKRRGCNKREHLQSELEFPAPHFPLFSAFPAAPYLHPLRLLRFRIVILRPRRKILQRFEILQHIVIFQDRQILHQSLVVIRDNWRNRGAGAVAKPQRHQ